MIFDTKTEEAFYNLMKGRGYKCKKIRDKTSPSPDFLCEDKNGYQAVFELKDFKKSGSTRFLLPRIVIQNITIKGTLKRFLNNTKKKISVPKYSKFPSGLVITYLRPFGLSEKYFEEIKRCLKEYFNQNQYPEIGTVIVAGFNEPSNTIVALHIFENQFSERNINKKFFKDLNHKHYEL